MTINKEEKIENIRIEILDNSILKHPFLINLSEGKYNYNQIKSWVSQQFYFSRQFPRCLGCLWSRIEDFKVSLPLMRFLAIEHWGSNEEGAHWKQYRNVLEYFDYTIDVLSNKIAFEETENYLSYRFDVCRLNTVQEGLGCMGFAHELVNEKIFEYYYKGINSITDSEKATQYFKSHVDDEPEDYEIFKKIIMNYCHTEEDFKLVRLGAIQTLEQRYLFFTKIQERIEAIK